MQHLLLKIPLNHPLPFYQSPKHPPSSSYLSLTQEHEERPGKWKAGGKFLLQAGLRNKAGILTTVMSLAFHEVIFANNTTDVTDCCHL